MRNYTQYLKMKSLSIAGSICAFNRHPIKVTACSTPANRNIKQSVQPAKLWSWQDMWMSAIAFHSQKPIGKISLTVHTPHTLPDPEVQLRA